LDDVVGDSLVPFVHSHNMLKERTTNFNPFSVAPATEQRIDPTRCSRVIQCRVHETHINILCTQDSEFSRYIRHSMQISTSISSMFLSTPAHRAFTTDASTWSSSKPAEKGRQMMRRGFPSSDSIWSQTPVSCSFTHESSRKGTRGR